MISKKLFEEITGWLDDTEEIQNYGKNKIGYKKHSLNKDTFIFRCLEEFSKKGIGSSLGIDTNKDGSYKIYSISLYSQPGVPCANEYYTSEESFFEAVIQAAEENLI